MLQSIPVDTCVYPSPIGRLALNADEQGVSSIRYLDNGVADSNATRKAVADSLRLLVEELDSYFDGELQQFTCKLNPQGTEFQQSVWRQLLRIPYGATASYGEIATDIGKPKACRAVGRANNRNPIPIVIPCHRVIGSDARLVGYAGGMWKQQWLLEHEGVLLPTST